MPVPSLSSRPTLRQLPLAFIAALSCILSFWMTVRFFHRLCPREGRAELVVMAVIWECAKLVFGTYGLHVLVRGSLAERTKGVALLAVSVILAFGSIAASLGFLAQADAQEQQASLASSQAYLRTQKHLAAVNEQVSLIRAAAAKDLGTGYRARGMQAMQQVTALSAKAEHLGAELTRQEKHPINAGVLSFFDQLANTFGLADADRVRMLAQSVLAVMLEVIGMIALSMLRTDFLFEMHASGSPRDQVSPPSSPSLRLVRNRGRARASMHAKRRIENDARGRGDTGTDTAGKNTRYERAKELVASNGVQPSYRSLQRALQVSQGTACGICKRCSTKAFCSAVGGATLPLRCKAGRGGRR